MDIVRFALLGIGAGAVYALAAQGIVLVYRGSGVLNFAHGAMGMLAAFIFYDLRGGPGWPIAACLVVAVGATALVGALTHLLVMRPLRRASALARLIATLGVLALLQSSASRIFGDDYRIVPSILPTGSVSPFHRTPVGIDRLLLFGVAAALSAVLLVVYRSTRFGLATSAVSENTRATAALGLSPDLIATVNWAAGAALAGIAAILIVPLASLQVTSLTLLVIPALAAALVGGFSSFPLTLLGGMAIGIAESEMARYVTTPGWSKSVPFLAIIAVLVIRGRALPLRGEVADRPPELGTGRVPVALLLGAIALGAGLVWFVFSASWLEATVTTLTVAIVVLSFVVVTGFAGQLSLAQFALAGMGAWAAARATVNYHVPFPVAVIIGVATAIPIGVVVGLPALRSRGVNLAVATLGLALVIEELVFNSVPRTGGLQGTDVGRPHLAGLDVSSARDPRRFALVALVLFVGASLMVANLRRGRAGRRLIAVRTNERAATALGIGVTGAKLYAFGVSAGVAGLGGVLMAFRNPFVEFTQFTIFASINAVLLAVIGGVGYVIGGLIGGIVSQGALFPRVVDGLLGNVEQYVKIVSAVLLLGVLISDPDGLASYYVNLLGRALQRVRPTPAPRVLSRSSRSERPQRDSSRPDSTLEVQDLTVRFGGVTALEHVSLRVGPGEVVGLIGPNGAGKSTLIDAVTGFVTPAGGTILLDGVAVDRWSAVRRARSGIGRSFQSLELFESMTVRDNLRAASDDRDRLAYVSDLVWPGDPDLSPAGWDAVHDFGLADLLEQRPEEIAYGSRRLVAIARALAASPSVLLLDEPAAGLDERESAELGELLVRLAHESGVGVLLVEHDVSFVFRVCDRIVAVDFGRKIAEGPPVQVRDDPAVIAAYLGEPADGEPASVAIAARPEKPGSSPLLAARRLSAGYGQVAAVHDLDLEVRPGEVVALLGPNGAGKTTTLLTLAGDLAPLAGEVLWRDQPTRAPLHRRVRDGLALVTEERSVFMRLTAAANLALGPGDPDRALELFPELEPLLKRRAGLLSGGEQQILTLARALAAEPAVLLADELSLGLSPLVVARLLRAVREAADRGTAVLLIEQHVHRALEVADRALVLNNGRVVLEGPAHELRARRDEIERAYLRVAS